MRSSTSAPSDRPRAGAEATVPLRVALFSGNYNYLREGANQALNRAVDYLERGGHRVRVYSPVTGTPAFEPAGTLVPVPSMALPVRSEFRLALGLRAAARRDVAAFAPDIVHLSTPDWLGFAAQRFARRLGVPVVASLHTRFEAYLDHYGLGWARPAVESLLRRYYRRADRILVPTEGLRGEMAAIVGHDRIDVWSRGVDRDLFDPARRDQAWRRRQGWNDADLVVLFFGRLVREKGVDPFVAAVARLQAEGRPVRPLVVGAGPDRGRFERLAGLCFTGHIESAELARAVASADVLLHPSRTETFGNVMLEAMAAGLAVVAADAPSARGLVEDGIGGRLVASDDPAGYAAAVAALADAPELRRQFGAAARRASAAFTWDSASQAVERSYKAALGRTRPAV